MTNPKTRRDSAEIARIAQEVFKATLEALADKRLVPTDDDRDSMFSAIYWAVRNARSNH